VVAATTITTLSYFVERAYSATQAREDIENLLKLFEVASVGRKVLEDALAMDFEDYEDAVLHEAARAGQADGIVTRNTKDFDRAVLAIYSPLELLHVLQAHI
jgi:DNA-binding ferritin-like protein (Dps family)